jgi:hypothetical protein
MILVLLMTVQAKACTLFVLRDREHALFCNNEDSSHAKTRIWFVPAERRQLGCVCVGYDDGWAQGGMNTAGLAFDWVAGYQEQWARGRGMETVRGNPCQLMLRTCRTVDEAVDFFRTHWEPSFSYAKLLVADASGASVQIGAHDGQLVLARETRCRGFGFGQPTLERMLAPAATASVENALAILRAAHQTGPYATKYSNVFDLKTGDVVLLPVAGDDATVTLNLTTELARGSHYYDMPQIKSQLTEPLRPWPRRSWWHPW